MRRIVNDEGSEGTVMFDSLLEIGFLRQEAAAISNACRQVFLKLGNVEKKKCKLGVTKKNDFLSQYVKEQLRE